MRHYRHVVWDWNGTLLDDFEITARITIEALAELGVPDVTIEEVRHHYCRPLSRYFSALLGREATAADLDHLGSRYDHRYGALMHELQLAADAVAALEIIAGAASQSLLSMAPQEQLNRLVDSHGLRPRFTLIEGFAGAGHPTKHESLSRHCRALRLERYDTCLIGDTIDDYEAARSLGFAVILVATGMQSRDRLESTGAPVVDSLREAAALFLSSRDTTKS
jgi:phosphoglycolate phosphatase-like HAD superfamily hydrolase